jgi:hypothetical protein
MLYRLSGWHEKINGGRDCKESFFMDIKQKANSFFERLPFKTMAKVPMSDKAIPFANQIAAGLVIVLAVMIVACDGKKNFYGGNSDLSEIADAAKNAARLVKGSGKNYILSKDTDFNYDLTTIDDKEYVVIQSANLPDGYNIPEGSGNNMVIIDTLTVKIPKEIEGYTVGAIGDQAFQFGIYNLGVVTSVIIPDTVVEIGLGAFSGSSISFIKLPENLKKLGNNAFGSCENLGGSINIPAGITEIPRNAFNGGFINGNKITEVVIPDSVTIIGEYAFLGCKELTTVKLPSHPIQYLHWSMMENKLVLGSETGYGDKDGENGAFESCGKLSLATRKAIQDSGYKGGF